MVQEQIHLVTPDITTHHYLPADQSTWLHRAGDDRMLPGRADAGSDDGQHTGELVFYHRILRCFVLIDLKIDDLRPHDIGQMNMYLGYFANEENVAGDNPPIGIVLTTDKDELLVEYATYQMNAQLFVAKYQLYLPDREELRQELEKILVLERGEEMDE